MILRSIKNLTKRYVFRDAPRRSVRERVESKLSDGRVYSGVFRGMKYLETSIGGAHLPKLLGTYELELAPMIERIKKHSFRRIIDVGAAEGYYVVGLALGTQAELVGFETQGPDRMLALARLNGVADRVQARGFCDLVELRTWLVGAGEVCVIVDAEGSEALLLDPRLIPELERAWILVEVHEFAVPGVAGLLRERFCRTHLIEQVLSRERTVADFPLAITSTWFDPEIYTRELMEEYRPEGMSWLFMEPALIQSAQNVASREQHLSSSRAHPSALMTKS